MDTTTATMHPAEEYLRNEQNPPVLYVKIYGERRKLFINRGRETSSVFLRKANANMATSFQTGATSKKSIIRHRKRKTKRMWTGK